jgi:glutathione S-transferase
MASKAVYGEDMLAHLPIKAYSQQMGQRASVQKVNEDRKACMALMAERAVNKPR